MNYKNIKLILWDYGGVLTYSPFLNIKDFEKFSNIKQNSIIKINSNKPFLNAWAKLEKNLISFTEFSSLFKEEAKNIGINHIDPMKLLECLEVSLNKSMVSLLKKVSKKYTCACLTNNFKKKNFTFNRIKNNFDYIFESSKIGLRKPEKEIYLYVQKKMKVKAQEILFIDDLGINLKPARELGFITYKFVNTEDTIEFFKKNLSKI
jgi:putative hydrolase of the HAD superfamily